MRKRKLCDLLLFRVKTRALFDVRVFCKICFNNLKSIFIFLFLLLFIIILCVEYIGQKLPEYKFDNPMDFRLCVVFKKVKL